RPPIGPEGRVPRLDRPPELGCTPRQPDHAPVEDEVARLDQGRRLGERAVEELPDRHPAIALVDDRAELTEQLEELRLVPVVDVLLPRPRAATAEPAGVGPQLGVLEEGVEDVEAKAVDATV